MRTYVFHIKHRNLIVNINAASNFDAYGQFMSSVYAPYYNDATLLGSRPFAAKPAQDAAVGEFQGSGDGTGTHAAVVHELD